MAQTVKNLPATLETQVWSLGWEDPLEKEMTIHSSIFAWEIPRTEEPGGLQSMGSQRVAHTHTHTQDILFSEDTGANCSTISTEASHNQEVNISKWQKAWLLFFNTYF